MLDGTRENNASGDWIEKKWKEFRVETFRETYNVLLSYPVDENNCNEGYLHLTVTHLIFLRAEGCTVHRN